MGAMMEVETGRETGTGVAAEIQPGGVELCVERSDIRFYNVSPDRMRIEVAVHNRGFAASQPTSMLLEAAPLGAFVPWQPLQRLGVPGIAAGERQVVSTEVMVGEDDGSEEFRDGSRERAFIRGEEDSPSDDRAPPGWATELLRSGNFEGLNAWDLVALLCGRSIRSLDVEQRWRILRRAIRSGLVPFVLQDFQLRGPEDREPSSGEAGLEQRVLDETNLLRRDLRRNLRFYSGRPSSTSANGQLIVPSLLSAMDPSRAAGRKNRHWAGNINVYLGGKAVERHQARGLRIYPGIENWALFNIGSRKGQEYLFTFAGCGPGWETRLFQLPNARGEGDAVREAAEVAGKAGEGVVSGDSVVTPMGSAWMAAIVSPPSDATGGKLDIDILEVSSGRGATVEFQMMVGAGGHGFYTF